MPNRLASATSPYLLQHMDNPVDWFEWGDEAFAEAERRDVPVLLSVGYAACHWCHVMAHESFEDPATATQMNRWFVNVKVDREERPDVDAVYMQALQAMTGQGGWPMTAFLTPQGQVFHAGTYFPPEPRHQLPSFRQVLAAVRDAWTDRRGEVEAAGRQLRARLSAVRPPRAQRPPDSDHLVSAVAEIAAEFDSMHGGFGVQPKFPPSMALEWLLRHHERTGHRGALDMVTATCERMARGGLYDQLDGGFARYSVDHQWVVPHFEKMLYDNALLLGVYAHWWRLTGDATAERVARETATFLLSRMRTPEGGFASSLDADADGREGSTYVWTPDELIDVLGAEDGRWAADLLSVASRGTFSGRRSVLQLHADPDDFSRWSSVRTRLLQARGQRAQPPRDDKVVSAWNGLAVAALASAGTVLDEPTWVQAAADCGDLLLTRHQDGGQLLRSSRAGRVGRPPGVLEDYACVADGYLALVGATGDDRWLLGAEALLDAVLTSFVADGELVDTAVDATDPRLGRRPGDPTDNATPSGRSAAASALLTYAAVTGSARHREAAEQALGTAAALGRQSPRFVSWGLAVAEALLTGPFEVAVVGDPDDRRTRELHRAAARLAPGGSVVVPGPPASGRASAVPLLRDRGLVDGQPAAYVCRGFVCDRPVTGVSALVDQLTGPFG